MKKQKMSAASNAPSKQQPSRLSEDRAEKGLGSKQTSNLSDSQNKKAPTTTSQSGAAVKSKVNK